MSLRLARLPAYVKVDDSVLGVFVHEEAHDMRADEACSASDDDGTLVVHGMKKDEG